MNLNGKMILIAVAGSGIEANFARHFKKRQGGIRLSGIIHFTSSRQHRYCIEVFWSKTNFK